MKKRVILSGLILSTLITACGNKYDYSQIPKDNVLSKQEVTDYYAEQMSYKNVVKRTLVNKDTIQWNPVPENLQEKLWEKTVAAIETHQLNRGYDAEMSHEVHDYLKLLLDDYVLTKPDGGNFKYTEAESQGFYFVTVDFDTKLNKTGTMKNEANLLGIDGVIVEGNDGVKINDVYLRHVLDKVNAARVAERLTPYDTFNIKFDNAYQAEEQPQETLPDTDAEGNVITGTDANVEETSESTEETVAETQAETTESVAETPAPVETQVALDDGSENETEAETTVAETSAVEQEAPKSGLYADNVRTLPYDISYINRAAGSSVSQTAVVPNVTMVYNPVDTEGEISGYGVYAEGSNGLRDFGYDRNNYKGGKIQITFVFKQNENTRDDFDYSYCYINKYESGIEMADNNITVSSYINGELDKVIERADRAFSNKDIAALMSRNVYESSDLGLREIIKRNSSNILTYMSSRVKTLQRNPNDDREYLVEVERTTEESPKGFGNTARYKDKYYMVIRQIGTEFKINDMVLVSRELTRIPDPDADDAITRRLTSLNLSGAVPEQAKTDITDMLNKLYYASTNRKLYDNIEDGKIVVTDGKIGVGIYDRFDTNRELLNQTKYDYLTSQLMTRLVKHTAKTGCKMVGQVTEWLGGYNDQVELTTEELYTYDGMSDGIYTRNYYLVSHYGTQWVIDDIVVIEEKEVDGEELQSLVNKMGNIDVTPKI